MADNVYSNPWFIKNAGPIHYADAGKAQAACIANTYLKGFKWVGYTANGSDTCVVQSPAGDVIWSALSDTSGLPISEARFSEAGMRGLYLKTLASGTLIVDVE